MLFLAAGRHRGTGVGGEVPQGFHVGLWKRLFSIDQDCDVNKDHVIDVMLCECSLCNGTYVE